MVHQSLFEQRMRLLESASNIFLNENRPIIIRVDGKGFHDFYKKKYLTIFKNITIMIMMKIFLLRPSTDSVKLTLFYNKHLNHSMII